MTSHAVKREAGNLTQSFVFCDGKEALPTTVPKSISQFNSEAAVSPSVPQH